MHVTVSPLTRQSLAMTPSYIIPKRFGKPFLLPPADVEVGELDSHRC